MITDSLGLVALAMGAGAGTNPTLARTGKLSRMIDWLGSARRQNEAINDEMETLKFEVEVLRWANKHLRAENAELRKEAYGWKETAKMINAEGSAAIKELTAAKPLIAYALKRKASLAAYELKRGRANG